MKLLQQNKEIVSYENCGRDALTRRTYARQGYRAYKSLVRLRWFRKFNANIMLPNYISVEQKVLSR